MLIGYARVSTVDQNLDLQVDALRSAGCGRIFSDRTSGARADRLGMREALDFAREGDVLIVWKLDRLSRSLGHLVETVQALERRSIGFRSLTELLDTNRPEASAIFPIFAALCSVERSLVRERTMAGLQAARQRGRVGGRPRLFTAEKKRAAARRLPMAHRPAMSRMFWGFRFRPCIAAFRRRNAPRPKKSPEPVSATDSQCRVRFADAGGQDKISSQEIPGTPSPALTRPPAKYGQPDAKLGGTALC
jgi:DNA invertase Pin-like site-specific DNA recombinase